MPRRRSARLGSDQTPLSPGSNRSSDWRFDLPVDLQWRLFRMIVAVSPLAFFAGAWLALSHGLGLRDLANDSATWPTADGVVVTAEVVERSSRGGDEFEPRIAYAYVVTGRPYTGHVVRSGGFEYGNRARAEAKLAEYPVGSAVTVRYDPGDPGRAVLEPGGGGDWWLFTGAGIASAVTGAFLLAAIARDRWYARPQ